MPYDVEELVGSLDKVREVARIVRGRRWSDRVHLALNSGGMSRNGLELRAEAGREAAKELVALDGLRVVGLMTHFPVEDVTQVRQGMETFKDDVAWLLANSTLRREHVLLHAANSFAIQNVPEAHLDIVRPGGALYGYSGTPKPPFAIVLIRSRRASVVGRVTMNTMMVDVTDISGVEHGDEVVLFGKQSGEQLTQAELQRVSGIGLAEQYTAWGVLNSKVVLHRRQTEP